MLNFLTANISPDGLRDHNADKSHVLKPNGIVDHAASASLQGTCGSALQLRPLCLAFTACSTIAQLRSEKLHISSALLCIYLFPEQIKRLTSRPVFPLLY